MRKNLGKKIGEGAGSEVFEWKDEHTIVKVAKPNTNKYGMKREYDNNRIVWEHGLSVPQPLEFLDLDGIPAIVFERIHGEALMKQFVEQLIRPHQEDGPEPKEAFHSVRMTAEVLSKVHQFHTMQGIPNQREQLTYSINRTCDLTSEEKASLLDLLDRLPVKQQLCHGDPNPGNILIRDGQAVLIDWCNASVGNPEADLAEYIIMIRYITLRHYLPDLPEEAVVYFDLIREKMVHVMIDEYTRLTGITFEEIDAWIAPVAARKLSADVAKEERNALLVEIRRRLQQPGKNK